jgi:hypothetical protein
MEIEGNSQIDILVDLVSEKNVSDEKLTQAQDILDSLNQNNPESVKFAMDLHKKLKSRSEKGYANTELLDLFMGEIESVCRESVASLKFN